MRFLSSLLSLTVFVATVLSAQTPAAPPIPAPPGGPRPVQPIERKLQAPIADTGIFAPLDLPPANEMRRPNGAPGRAYWQQRVDYSIQATLDTAAKRLTGQVSIRYTNHSPDTLSHLWMQLDQNLFKQGSVGGLLNAQESRFGGAGFDGGFSISSITQTPLSAVRATGRRGRALPVTTRIDDTMMDVILAQPLPPGGATQLDLSYAFTIPEHGADRMGRDGALYEMAQWYPRLCVYDDVHGWNTLQYLGQGEFYLEYGDFDYEVTLPAGYIVAGTGTVQNPLEVFTAAQRARLAAAARSDTISHIITAEELSSGAARPKQSGMLTWRFQARNVRDVAWAASPEYLWDASSWQGIMAYAYYRPSAVATWKDAADMSRFSIQEYSTRWLRYPYPQISAVEGPVSGMEYPMVAMEGKDESKESLYGVMTHEIGHMWFPMIVGSDERRYAWMDEGFNTFINVFSEEGYFKRDDSRRRRGEAGYVLSNDQAPTAQPIMTYANRYRTGSNLGSLAYIKPSLGLYTLRAKVLGPDVFDAAFSEYARRWAFKHPQPADFFRTMEDVSGRDLSWFWRGWFLTTAALDQKIESLAQKPNADGKSDVTVVIRNAGQQVMPVELQLTFVDGSSKTYNYPVEVWYKGDRYSAEMTVDQPVKSATVNPDNQFPDVTPGNNGWKGPATP